MWKRSWCARLWWVASCVEARMTKHRTPQKETSNSHVSQFTIHMTVNLHFTQFEASHDKRSYLTGVRTSDSPTIQLIYLMISFSFIWQFLQQRFQTVLAFSPTTVSKPFQQQFHLAILPMSTRCQYVFNSAPFTTISNTMPDQPSTNRMFLCFVACYRVAYVFNYQTQVDNYNGW